VRGSRAREPRSPARLALGFAGRMMRGGRRAGGHPERCRGLDGPDAGSGRGLIPEHAEDEG